MEQSSPTKRDGSPDNREVENTVTENTGTEKSGVDNNADDTDDMSFDKPTMAQSVPRVVEPVAVRFEDFTIMELLGEGSFGKVFKVLKKDTGKLYAMKSMKKQTLINNNQIRYAVTEAQIMREMDHAYVLKLMFSFQTPDYLHMVMELCEHGDLSQQLDQHQFFEEQLARFICAELILGIQHVHEKGVLYRDLKPENILIDADGHIRLGDFGLAKQGRASQVEAGKVVAQSFCGSPAYLAPEMLSKSGVSQSGDVYQIGVVLYEMLVGIPPFYNDNITILYQNISKGKLKVPKYLSKNVKNLLNKILHRDPNKRPTLEQMKADIFFAGIDWKVLATKRYRPPTKLGKPENTSQSNNDDLNAMFQDKSAQMRKNSMIFEDSDYNESNRSYNRVKNYTFSRRN
jgi:serine/threonine protein kinase